MFISNPFANAFGLDIGDLSLKLVQLRFEHIFFRPPHFKIMDLRSISMPPGYIVNGEIQQPEMVRKKLLHLLGADKKLKPIKSAWVVADLPEPKTFLKLITIDQPADELLDDDIIYQARKHLPFDLEDTYLDWQVVGEAPRGKPTSILLGAVPKIVADSYTYLLESTGLNVLALEIEGIPISRALITRAKNYQGEARAILDLGATRSSLIIYDKDSLQLSTNFNFSGEIITTAIAQELKIDYDAAERLKIKYGAAYVKEYPKYFKIISEQIETLINEVKKTMQFYHDHFLDTNPITHITMCGGLSNLKNVDNIISAKLKITARPGNVWKNILSFPPTPEQQMQGLALAPAIGLAMRAAEHPLPPSIL